MRIIAFITLLFLSVSAFAEEAKKPVFDYRTSDLGIDYKTLAPYPLGAILSQGEGEFFGNAVPVFKDETKDAWLSLLQEVATGLVSKYTVCDLEEFTPLMLRDFAFGLEPNDKEYGGLWSTGNAFVMRGIADAVAGSDETKERRC